MALDAKQLGSALNTIAYGQTMMAAVRDYAKEMEAEQKASRVGGHERDIDMQQLAEDPELERLHADRIAQLQREAERRAELSRKGHGEYQDVSEGDFLEAVTQADMAVAHFYHADFERCKIVDRHMAALASQYFNTRFIKISAPDAPFFTVKLKIKMLPCIIMFKSGVAVDRVVGFEELGGKDDFAHEALDMRLRAVGVVVDEVAGEESEDEEAEQHTNIRRGLREVELGSGDEDSDFD